MTDHEASELAIARNDAALARAERDAAVAKLAEEIAEMSREWGVAPAGNVEEKILAFLAEREAALQAQLHRALGEGAGLREAVEYVISDASIYRDLTRGTEDRLRRALASAPLSERAGEVWKAVAELAEQVPREEIGSLSAIRERLMKVAGQVDRVVTLWDALRAELQKGGEGRGP